ncbi:MAG: hypothetical protein R3264_09165, partial [Anaerolineae bacterium]|nr:hypothetical protein [Anaerolineae bacterium]
MPDELKKKKKALTKLQNREAEAGQQQDWEEAAKLKAERLRLEEEFDQERERWWEEKDLDEVVEAK